MDISLLIRQRLETLGLGQKDIAIAADVTESYISQLLTRKKAPPAPERTDIYEKIGSLLELPTGELAKLAQIQRHESQKKKAGDPAGPLFEQCRELVLRKCVPEKRSEIAHIFSKDAFGELERMITQTLLHAAQEIAREGLRNEVWQRQHIPLNGGSYEQSRVAILEFLDTDVFDVSVENCVVFLEPIIDSWNIDLKTFSIEVSLSPTFAERSRKRFAFSEQSCPEANVVGPGFEQFLSNATLSGDATDEEIEFLKSLRFRGRQPSALYYYRELQNLRDPLHFLPELPSKPLERAGSAWVSSGTDSS